TDLTIGSTSGTHLRVISGAVGVRNSSGDVLANLSSSGSDGVVSASSGDLIVTTVGGGDLQLAPSGDIDLTVDTAASAGASQGYITLKINGTLRRIQYYAVG